jgi:hypothetical protein
LPMAVLKILNYRDPSAEEVASYDDYMVYKREDALKLSKLLLAKWEIPQDEVDTFFKELGPSNEVLGMLANKLLLRVLVGQERYGDYFKTPHKQFEERSFWQQIQMGEEESARVKNYLMSCVGR